MPAKPHSSRIFDPPSGTTAPLIIDAISTALIATLSNAAVYPLNTIVTRLQAQRLLLAARRDKPLSKGSASKYLVDEGAFGGKAGKKVKPRRGSSSSSSSSDDEKWGGLGGLRKKKVDRKLSGKLDENLRREAGELYGGVMDAFEKIVRKEGYKGFLRGLVDDSIETFCATLLYIGAYNLLKRTPLGLKHTNFFARHFPTVVATLLSHLISPILLPAVTQQQLHFPSGAVAAKGFMHSYVLSVAGSLLKHVFSSFSSAGGESKSFIRKLFNKLLAVFLTYPVAVLKTCHNLEIPAGKVFKQGLGVYRGVDGELVRSGVEFGISYALTPVLYAAMMAAWLLYSQGVKAANMAFEGGKKVASTVVEKTEITTSKLLPVAKSAVAMPSAAIASGVPGHFAESSTRMVREVKVRKGVSGREKSFERAARKSLRRHWEIQPRAETVVLGKVNMLDKGSRW